MGYGTNVGVISGLDKDIIFRMNASNLHAFKSSGEIIFGATAIVGTEKISLQGDTLLNSNVNMANLPTASAGLSSGDIWNNSGVLNIV